LGARDESSVTLQERTLLSTPAQNLYEYRP
jgi:hypothetical protein